MLFEQRKRVIVFSAFLLLLVISAIQSTRASAQEVENPWSQPYNLSKSGATTDPSPVVDSTGVVHVIWLDEFAGYMYSALVNGEWSEPKAKLFPFSEGDPAATAPVELINDHTGFIHAYWIGARNTLYHSVVAEQNFGNPGSWAGTFEIARYVSGFDTTVDAAGNLHLAYVRHQDDEGLLAGVYYRQSRDGYNWSSNLPVYLSPYYRAEVDAKHHVDISATSIADVARVFIGWDDPALNRVSIRKSNDGGETWDEPQDIALAGGTTFGGYPFGILVRPQGEDTLVIWQTGVPEESCSMSYTLSADGGGTWSEHQSLLGNLPGCPNENEFFESSDGTAILMATIQDQVYLLAWNGVQWSEPQAQIMLSGFKDPETNNLVTLSCRNATSGGENKLYYTGCDTDDTEDIWISDRSIGSTSDWFPPEPAWAEPVSLASNPLTLFNPVSISDSTGRIHVFWTQEDRLDSGDLVVPVYYTRSSEEGWLTPVHILNSPDNEAEHLQVAIDEKDRLFLVWNGHSSGEIYFSWASADQASNVSEWVNPVILPSIRPLNSSPSILSNSSGDLFVAYSLVLNENRGIYLVSSSDGGETWTSPSLVVDAVAAGLNMVDNPILSQTESGHLHLIFTQNAIPGDGNPIALYYTSSNDDGVTWSLPVLIVERSLDWFQMLSPGILQVQRYWQSVEQNVSSIWQELSIDDGTTWSRPVNVTSFGGIAGLVDVVSDPAGRLHLMQVVDDPAGGQILKHWAWDGERWSAQEDLRLTSAAGIRTMFIDTVGTIDGRLGISYMTERSPVSVDQFPFELRYSERIVALATNSATPEVAPLPTLQPTTTATAEVVITEEATITPTSAPISAPTSTPIGEQPGGGGTQLNNTIIGLGLGWILVMVMVVGAFVYELRRRKSSKVK